MNRINEIHLQCRPPLEKILYCMKARIEILLQSDFSPTIVFLKKDFENLEEYLKDKIII